MIYQREPFARAVPEIMKLQQAHWDEVGSHKEARTLDVNYGKYLTLERQGLLRFYTMRKEALLGGYWVGAVDNHIHSVREKIGQAMAYYTRPEFRGYAPFLFKRIETDMKTEGVKVLYQRWKKSMPQAGEFLHRLGYEDTEVSCAKVL